MVEMADFFQGLKLVKMAGSSQELSLVKMAGSSQEATEEISGTFKIAIRDTFKAMEEVMLTMKVDNMKN